MNFTDQFLKSLNGANEGGIHLITHLRALLLLKKYDGIDTSMGNLAIDVGVCSATMTGIADVLEKMHMVKRKTNKLNRRSINLSITHEGIEFLNKIMQP